MSGKYEKKKLSVIMTLSKTFKRNFTGYSLAQIESILLLKASYLKNLKCELSRLLALKCMGKGFIDEVWTQGEGVWKCI